MKKECNKFKADITDYARGAHEYVKDMDALFNHLRTCKSCLNKLFGLEETFAHLSKHKVGQPAGSPAYRGKKKSLDELKAMFRKGPPPEPKLTKLEGMLQQGIKSYKEGQYPTARILLNIVVKELADDAKLSDADRQLKADAYYHLGLTHEASNNIDGALYVFSRAIELDPDDADAHYYRADIYSRYNQLDAALRDYTIAIELNPDHEEALRERGLMFYSTNRLEAAMADAQRLLELEPGNGWYYLLRAMVYEMMGLFPEAVADSARAIELKDELAGDKRDIFAYTVRGRSYGMMSEYGKAVADFTALIKLSPRDANSYFYRGIIYARQSKLTEAIADFKKALALKPGDWTAADYLIQAERQLAAREIEAQVKKAGQQLANRLKKQQVKVKDYDAEINHLKREIDYLKDNQKLMLEIISQKPEYHYRIEGPMMPTGKPMRDIFPVQPVRPTQVINPNEIRIPDSPK